MKVKLSELYNSRNNNFDYIVLKNREKQKIQRIITLKIFMLIVSINLFSYKAYSQVTFSNSDNIVLNHGWTYLEETFYYPYDSTESTIETYPILSPYQKYIGQQIILVNSDFGNREKIGTYFAIIGVEPSKYGNSNIRYSYRGLDNKYEEYKIPNNEYPIFILENSETKDTLLVDLLSKGNDPFHHYFITNYLLVGGYIKLKEKYLNRDVVYYTAGDFNYSSLHYQSSIQSTWKCIDVSISTGRYYCEYCDDKNMDSSNRNFLALQIQDINNPQIIRNLKISCLNPSYKLELSDKIFNPITRGSNHRGFTFKEVFENEMESRRNAALAKEKKSTQELAKRKQILAAKYGAANAEKIIVGKYEIGMSKAVCKEIAGYATVIDKTATAETWQITYLLGYSTTYLYFAGDKLIRIIKL